MTAQDDAVRSSAVTSAGRHPDRPGPEEGEPRPTRPLLDERQLGAVAEALSASLRHAATSGPAGGLAQALAEAASVLSAHAGEQPAADRALPAVGSSVTVPLRVSEQDTAAAMGHPDQSVAVLGSPRLALWFELVASRLLPAPTARLTHVGAGILVHHLAPAAVGEEVAVRATVDAAVGRHVTFTCVAAVESRVVAIGAHQRVLRRGR
jgi:predicted thioesterase